MTFSKKFSARVLDTPEITLWVELHIDKIELGKRPRYLPHNVPFLHHEPTDNNESALFFPLGQRANLKAGEPQLFSTAKGMQAMYEWALQSSIVHYTWRDSDDVQGIVNANPSYARRFTLLWAVGLVEVLIDKSNAHKIGWMRRVQWELPDKIFRLGTPFEFASFANPDVMLDGFPEHEKGLVYARYLEENFLTMKLYHGLLDNRETWADVKAVLTAVVKPQTRRSKRMVIATLNMDAIEAYGGAVKNRWTDAKVWADDMCYSLLCQKQNAIEAELTELNRIDAALQSAKDALNRGEWILNV